MRVRQIWLKGFKDIFEGVDFSKGAQINAVAEITVARYLEGYLLFRKKDTGYPKKV